MSQRKVWPFGKTCFRRSSPRRSPGTRIGPPLAAQIEFLEDRTLLATSLGTAETFAVLSGQAVTNTGPTNIVGDLGVSPGTAVTGFPPGVVTLGTIHAADAVALQAQNDLTTAYNSVAGLAPTANLTGQDLGGLTLTPGVYFFSSSAQLTGTLTLNALGNPNAEFDFQIGSSLTTASSSSVVMTGGGNLCNVFWQVGSSATLGTTTAFEGHILALTSITLTHGATVQGSVLARNGAVTLDDNLVSVAACLAGTATISGSKFDDLVGSGVRQPNDPPMSGVTVFLDTNNNGVLDPGERSTVTDINGNFVFLGVAPGGPFIVREVLPAGSAQTTPNPAPFALVAGQTVSGVTFGNHFAAFAPITISGTKFQDTNGSGIRDPGEPGLPGFTIFLDSNNNGVLDPGETSTTTAANGSFTFPIVGPGTFRVLEVGQINFVQMTNNPAPIVITTSSASVSGVLFGNTPVFSLFSFSKLLLTGRNLTNLLNGTFAIQANFVANLFETLLGHAPDINGLTFYLRLLMAGYSEQQVTAMFRANFKV